jgi:putative endonuclease
MSNKSNNRKTGDIGEQIAANYLVRKGFRIVERNYWRKWGEIDIVAELNKRVHFVEVKTVSYETAADLKRAVSHETWRPEEQVHQFKLHQIHKAIETWLADHNYEGDWQIDVAAVRIVPRETYATVKYIPNIIAD